MCFIVTLGLTSRTVLSHFLRCVQDAVVQDTVYRYLLYALNTYVLYAVYFLCVVCRYVLYEVCKCMMYAGCSC